MQQKPQNHSDDDEGDVEVSKSQRKREMHELQALGERLTTLNEGQIGTLDLSDKLREAVRASRTITQNGARRRHMQYIGRLMRLVDANPIREKLREWDGQSRGATVLQHQLERWRDRLMDDDGALSEYLAAHAETTPAGVIDIQHLRTLIRNARDERTREKPLRYFRELFRELKRIEGDRSPQGEQGDA